MRLLWKHSFLASTRCDNSAVDMMNHTMANVNPPFKLNLRANISVWIIYEQKWKDVSFDSNRSSTPTFTSCHEMLEFSWIAAELWRKDKVFKQHKKGQTYGWKVERKAQQRAEEVESWELKSNITLIAQNYGWTTHTELESFCGLTLLGKGIEEKSVHKKVQPSFHRHRRAVFFKLFACIVVIVDVFLSVLKALFSAAACCFFHIHTTKRDCV